MKSYLFSIILFASILIGALTGYVMGPAAQCLKPLGDIFLNLLFTAIVPLVFFSVAASIAQLGQLNKLWKVICNTATVFLFTGFIAAAYMIFVVKLFPIKAIPLSTQLTQSSDLNLLFAHVDMLTLIIVSFLTGLVPSVLGKKGRVFSLFLQAGTNVFMQVIKYIMFYAPVGFFAYFAVLAGELGPRLLQDYFQVTLIYYSAALLYFLFAFTGYAYLAGKKTGIKIFWKNATLPTVTALATCSSAASIPANFIAAKQMGVPSYICDTVIPLGTVVHKDGSVLGGILKIAFLFSLFHLSFSGAALLSAMIIALLVGTVMGAIPSGGMLGEMLILSFYGFPSSTLMLIAAISIVIDPLATMVNVTGNSVCSMMIARMVEGHNWMQVKLNQLTFVTANNIGIANER